MADTEPEIRRFYRAVTTDPPTALDFTSNEARGRPLLDPTPDNRRLWSGLSCWATEAQARRSARRFRSQGTYIAALTIEPGAPIVAKKTRGPGHYTLWDEPAALLARLVSVTPV